MKYKLLFTLTEQKQSWHSTYGRAITVSVQPVIAGAKFQPLFFGSGVKDGIISNEPAEILAERNSLYSMALQSLRDDLKLCMDPEAAEILEMINSHHT